MRIAITGASGNVGTALLRAIDAARGDDSVIGLSRRAPADEEPYAGVEWQTVDLSENASQPVLEHVFRGVDAVVHLAIGFQPMRDREYLRATNVGGVERVAHACAVAGVRHLIHMSSGGIYVAGAYGREVDESWPRAGVPSSTYSMDKAAAENVLDRFEALHPEVAVARVRPGLIGQFDFGSAVLRYALPDVVPSSVVRHLPLLPIDRRFCVPAVHSNDVADILRRILERGATGAFNVAAPTPVRASDVAKALGAGMIPVPHSALSAAVKVGYAAHLLPIHQGWVDLAFTTPLLDASRAEQELDWKPTLSGPEVLQETVAGMRNRGSAPSASLRERSVGDRVRSFARRGFVSRGRPS